MDVPFDKNLQIKKISAADQVCDKIKQYVREGRWKIGERIPTERELAGLFGVNRLTVRLALQKLNNLGILETRTGSGTYVVEFNLYDYINEASEFFMEPELLESVCEFRKLVEIECARLAIERATPEETKKLKLLLYDYMRNGA